MAEIDDEVPRRAVSRRDVLGIAGGAVVGAGAVGAGLGLTGNYSPLDSRRAAAVASKPTSKPTSEPEPALRRFVSTMLTTPVVTTWTRKGASPTRGFLFASPRTDVSNGVIMQNDGEPVWIEPDGISAMDVRVQEYEGKPVLTYWSGKEVDGHGFGACTIKDTSYRTIATVRAGDGMIADMHEFTLTSRGTALLIAYPVISRDLSPLGGPSDGYIYGCRFQEVDVASGKVLLDWDALDHLDLTETYQKVASSKDGGTPETAFDPFHLNSVEDDGDALLLSARHTHAVYSIDRSTGTVRWRMGGRRSDFEIETAARFAWQHDARRRSHGQISLFDNNGITGDNAVSTGLLLDVDEQARTVRLHRKFAYQDHFGGAMGNLQILDNGNVLVGWGTDPTATEFTPGGTAIYEARDIGATSYRVYRGRWSAHPDSLPDVAVRHQDDARMRVYVSWNGATEISKWRILTGADARTLQRAAVVRRKGFETSRVVRSARTVVVQALDANGKLLSASAPHRT